MSVSSNTEKLVDFTEGLDTFWLILCGCLIFLMQCGFALIEGGAVRAKSVSSVLLKNFADSSIAAVTFYLYGYAFAFGDENDPSPNSFIGLKYFALVDMPTIKYAFWFFQFTFVSTCGTIVSGAVAERLAYSRYYICVFLLNSWVYPIVVHAAWSNHGWLSVANDGSLAPKIGPAHRGVYDFAGSGVIHLVGGVAAIVSCALTGPRYGRYDTVKGRQKKGHSLMMGVLGTLFLLFSWYGFNAGSSLRLSSGGGTMAARSVVTTTLSSTSAAITTMITRFITSKFTVWDIEVALNGSLAGAVGITAACALVEPWASLIIGALSGWTYLTVSFLLDKVEIDDPVDAGPVHFGCGLLGLLMPGIFASPAGILEAYGIEDVTYAGIVHGGSGIQLGYQVLFATFIIVWTTVWVALLFVGMKLTVGLRVAEEDEKVGLDEAFHGVMAYDYLEAVHEMARLKDELRQLTVILSRASDGRTIGDEVFNTSRNMDNEKMEENPGKK